MVDLIYLTSSKFDGKSTFALDKSPGGEDEVRALSAHQPILSQTGLRFKGVGRDQNTRVDIAAHQVNTERLPGEAPKPGWSFFCPTIGD